MMSDEVYSLFSEFKPDLKYLRKSYFYSAIGSVLASAIFLPLGTLFLFITLGPISENSALVRTVLELVTRFGFLVVIILILFFVFLGIMWSRLVYNALSYHVTKSEITIKSGVIFKKDVTIPMRTVTNIDVILGPIDRLFGLATMNIQTAGSVSILAEGRIVGLLQENSETLRDLLKNRLQQIQGGDGTGIDSSSTTDGDPVEKVLSELRAIKNVLIDIRDQNESKI